MFDQIHLLKGLHPGFYLERELHKRHLKKGPFAISIGEYPQTLVSITKAKRRMNTSMAMKIEKTLELEEGFLMILQVFYDIKAQKKSYAKITPDLSKLRPVLFWDTEIGKIDWMEMKESVLERVMERGNEQEREEILNFYRKYGT